jgi:hypothetical protein
MITVQTTTLDKRFFTAGHAIFTVANPAGDHYTYRINKAEFDGNPASGKLPHVMYFLSLLTGPENTSDFAYVGAFDPTFYSVRLTKASRYTEDSKPLAVARWAAEVGVPRQAAAGGLPHPPRGQVRAVRPDADGARQCRTRNRARLLGDDERRKLLTGGDQ